MRVAGTEIDDGHAARNGRHQLRCRRLHVLAKVFQRKAADPRIEDLHGLHASVDLQVHVVGDLHYQLLQQRPPRPRVAVHEALHVQVVLRTLPFDRIRGQGERRASETDQRNVRGQFAADEPDRLGDVGRPFPRRDHLQGIDRPAAANRIGELRTKPGQIVQLQAHRFQHRQQVREHDRGIHAEDALRIAGDPRRQFRRLEEIQGRRVALHLVIFLHIAPRLTVEPYRGIWRGRAAAGPQESRLGQTIGHKGSITGSLGASGIGTSGIGAAAR